MNKKIFLVSIIFFFSCNSLVKKIYGVKKIEFQSKVNQIKFLNKYEVKNSDYFYFKNFNSYIQASKEKFLSIPDAYFFNNMGEYIPYQKTSSQCNAKVDSFIIDLKNFNKYSSDKSIKMENFLSLLTSDKPINVKKTDIKVFLTWAVFAGKINKQKTFDWINLIETAKNNDVDISYYLINCDLQESWNLNENQKKQIQNLFN